MAVSRQAVTTIGRTIVESDMFMFAENLSAQSTESSAEKASGNFFEANLGIFGMLDASVGQIERDLS